MTALTLPRAGSSLLSDGDRHVIWLLAEEFTTHEIARWCRKAPAIIERRIRGLLARTGTDTTADLVATAVRCGWIDLAPWQDAA